MSAPRFLGVDQHGRDVATGLVFIERPRCPGRRTTIKPQSCGKTDQPALLVVIDEYFA